MRKTISLFLVFSVLSLSVNVFAKEKRGADLIILRTDGTQVRGELIAVKQNSFLLLDRESGADVTVDVGDVSIITIVRKSMAFGGAGFGAILGAVIGGGIGQTMDTGSSGFGPSGGMVGILAGGLAGVLIGALGGMALGTDKTFQIYGKSDSEIQEILRKLRKRARVKNAM